MSAGIEVINVSKQYNILALQKIDALRNISFSISKGEYVGLLGMNGSGKSTLARLLNGLLKPSEGKVYINGIDTADPANLSEIRRIAGMVFQNPDNQLVCPIVEEEIAFGPENLELPLTEIRRRVDWALQICDLEDKRHHAPHLLSGGQKQMVALASVLAMLPEYLILDEPTSMLDPQSRSMLLKQLYNLNKQEGMTIILISHNPEDLLQADRLIVLDQGSISLEGTTREVYANEKLKDLGLDAPSLYQLINQMESNQFPVPESIKSIPGLAEHICREL
jgi:energy-coupling factor transport system ATP-binding protein